MTARFGNTKPKFFEFISDSPEKGDVSHDRIFYKPGDMPTIITATPKPGCKFEYWEEGDGNRWDLSSTTPSFTIDDVFYNNEYKWDGMIFKAVFSGTPIKSSFEITVKSAGWRGNSWSMYVDQKCKVGIIGDLSSGDYRFQATEGSSVTIYAEGWNITGNIGDGQYVNGFYTKDHTLLRQSPKPGNMPSWTDTYTFTVTGNKEIYVDFQNN